MTKTTKVTALLLLAALLAVVGCGQQAAEAPVETLPPHDTPTVAPTPTPSAEPAAAEVTAPSPTETPSPTPTTPSPTPTAVVAAPPAAADWGEICQPSPAEQGKEAASLALGSTVELEAYLYVKSFAMIGDGMMPFTLREIAYGAPDTNWNDACQIHLLIPIGSGPNHVTELPDKFDFGDVVVWDNTGREIRGWQRNLDSYRVRVVGVVVETYGTDTGLPGSNTIRLQEVQLLEG
jgi:hypothetical protein